MYDVRCTVLESQLIDFQYFAKNKGSDNLSCTTYKQPKVERVFKKQGKIKKILKFEVTQIVL